MTTSPLGIGIYPVTESVALPPDLRRTIVPHFSLSLQTTRLGIPTRNFFGCAARCSGALGRGREDHLNGINVGRPPLRCAASWETGSGLTRIPFFSFGNIIAIKATAF